MEETSDQIAKRAYAPGVHFQETAMPKRPDMQTGVPVFVGFGHVIGQKDCECFKVGRINIFRMTCAEQLEQCIMIDVPHGFLDYAIRGFFENGGQSCVVVPLEEGDSDEARIDALHEVFRGKGVLEDIDSVDLVCVPDMMRKEILSLPERLLELREQVLDYCRRMEDRFAVFDWKPAFGLNGQHSIGQAAVPSENFIKRSLRDALEEIDKISHRGRPIEGAAYFPWICVEPLERHKDNGSVWVPPCGHVAGIYARSDRMFGVHKAPANEVVAGVVDLEAHVSDKEQIELNKFGLNCLRSFPGRGIRVWGARTLSSQPDWRYINVRRLILTLVRWSRLNLADFVFEPNAPFVWDRVRDRIAAYCLELYQRGALKGRGPAEAFYVKCDAETNPADIRETGQLICEVGLAPAMPAEFVVVRLIKNAAGTTATILTGT